jgi:hypothetical protein
LRDKKNKIIAKILCLSKQEKLPEKYKEKIIRAGLNSLDEFNKLETRKQKEYKEKKQAEPDTQQAVLSVGATGSTNSPSLDFSVDFPNPFDNPDFVASLANYDPLDPFWLGQGVGFGILQTSQDS